MDVESFAARRRESLRTGDEAVRPAVVEALQRRADGAEDWADGIVDAAAQVWLENYQAEAPGARHEAALTRFRRFVRESLAQTGESTNVDRVTRWASTLAVNAGTINGASRVGVAFKRWVTMDDAKVRDLHEGMDGKTVPMGSTFLVGGSKLPYPGAPVGPPEVWIECRCVAMPAARRGETMSTNTFAMEPDAQIEDENPDIVLGNNAFADQNVNPDGTPYTGALVVLVPAESDLITAASSEPAHVTTIWFGDLAEMQSRDTPEFPQIDLDTLHQEVRNFASDLDGPVVVPVRERGTLGEDDADVVFLEPTDSLLALRDGLLANEQIGSAYNAVEQFPEWTPHVTLGYPDRPARGEYDADSVTFDRVSLWLGGEHYDYPMGGTVSETITADASSTSEVDDQGDLTDAPTEVAPEDDAEPTDEEMAAVGWAEEIPIHGVLAPEGVETGDRRGFRPGALSTRKLPFPFRHETVGSHGGNNTSEVVDAGRIDEAWYHEPTGMWRYRGAIVMSMPGAAAAFESILAGVRTGVSIDADQMADDVETYTQEYVEEAMAQGKMPTQWYKEVRTAGLTHVPIPAFEEAYVGLGEEFDEDLDESVQDERTDAVLAAGCLFWADDVVDLSTDTVIVERENEAGTGIFGPFLSREEADAWIATAGDGEYTVIPVNQAITAAAGFKDYDADARKRMAGNGQAMPDGSFPIADEQDLRNAIQSVGRASDPDAARAHIKKRAAVLGKTNLLPEDWSGEVAAFAQFKRGAGWITDPVATNRIHDYWTEPGKPGYAKIAWGTPGDFARAKALLAKYIEPRFLNATVAQWHHDALGYWPATHKKMLNGRHALMASGDFEPAPILTIVAAAGEPRVYPAEFFTDPGFDRVTPLTIDKATGRVYGHLAQWKSCHIGINGACTKPPKSRSGYANFIHGVVDTDQGEQPVGTLTYGIGHANPMLRAAAATAHYDQTDAVFAFVNVGEDEFGIWYAGVLRPGTTDDMIDDVRAIGALSGDWRRFPRYGLDLVAAVSVNTPGYSLAASGTAEWEGHGDGQSTALGLGLVDPREQVDGETHEDFAERVALRAAAIVESRHRREGLASRVQHMRLADARRRIERII